MKVQEDLLIQQSFRSYKRAILIMGWGQKPDGKIETMNINASELVHKKDRHKMTAWTGNKMEETFLLVGFEKKETVGILKMQE